MAVGAFLTHKNHLYFTKSEVNSVGTLIEGVWEQFPDQARYITRERIYYIGPLTPLSDGMLKVAAKRASSLDQQSFDSLFTEDSKNKTPIEILPSIPKKHALDFEPLQEKVTIDEAMKLAHRIAEKSELKIAAVLLDREENIVSWGWNNHFQNRTLHAEVMLVKNFQARSGLSKIPAGYTLISTLQPCAMCAGYLHGHSENFSSLKILWERDDLGPMAQNSILVEGSTLWDKLQSS